MSLEELLDRIQGSSLAAAVRGDSGWEWLFPNIETCHVLALALVFGSIVMVDLRLLGITSRDSPVSKLAAECLPYTWIAFICALITGTGTLALKVVKDETEPALKLLSELPSHG